MNILLVDVPLSPYSWNQEPAPPLGLLYLAAAVRHRLFGIAQTHEVVVLPLQLHKVLNRLDPAQILVDTIQGFRPDVIGFSTQTPSTPIALALAQVARLWAPTAVIVMGGYQATVDTEGLLTRNSEVDVLVRGEGEKPFCELIHLLEEHAWDDLHRIPGIAYRKDDGRICTTLPAKRIRLVESLPFPDRSLVPMKILKDQGNQFRAGGIISSRGCPWTCTFCYSPALWGTGIYRSPRNVVDEIEHLVVEYGLEYIRFEDDTFTTNRRRVMAICDEIKARGLNIQWEARTRVDLVDEELFVRMREVGLQRLQVGLESLEEKSLFQIDKKVSAGKYDEFFNIVRKADLGLIITIIIGLPSETPAQMEYTIEWVEQRLIPEDRFIRCMFTPFPGTVIDQRFNPVVLSHDLAKYTMDIPLATSDLFNLEELVAVKTKADRIMRLAGPHHAQHGAIPQDAPLDKVLSERV